MKRTLSEDAWLASVGKHRGVAIRILDIIEEMLESKGIMIPDEDRTGEESEANLYGITYATLEDEISDLLGRYYDPDTNKELIPDPGIPTTRIIRTIATEGYLAYKDIRTFETEGYFGIWDHTETAFVLIPKTNFQFHRIVLDACHTLEELDDAVFKECFEHIRFVSSSGAYSIAGKYK